MVESAQMIRLECFALLTLEKGAFEVPAFDLDARSMQLSVNQLHFILQGISLGTIKYRRRYQHQPAK